MLRASTGGQLCRFSRLLSPSSAWKERSFSQLLSLALIIIVFGRQIFHHECRWPTCTRCSRAGNGIAEWPETRMVGEMTVLVRSYLESIWLEEDQSSCHWCANRSVPGAPVRGVAIVVECWMTIATVTERLASITVADM